MKDLLDTTKPEPFTVGTSNLDYFSDRPQRTHKGIILWCLQGEAEITVNLRSYQLIPGVQIIILPQDILMLSAISSDFNVRFFTFSPDMLHEACFRMGPDFFTFIKDKFYFTHKPEDFEITQKFMDVVSDTYLDKENMFRQKIATNYLQNFLLNIYDKISRHFFDNEYEIAGRQNAIFKDFVQLVKEHGSRNRDVCFFADKLSITTRYLSTITNKMENTSPKQFIDNFAILEIKSLLETSNLSIQEIADKLNFPDQSNLGRFFKNHTGLSPREYRNRKYKEPK